VKPDAADRTSGRRISLMNRKALTLLTALVATSLLVSGCVAAAAAAGGAGGYAWSRGKLSFTTPHNIASCHTATISALAELGIKVTADTTDSLSGKIKGVTKTGEDVAVDLEPQSQSVTKIDVRVGFWGNETEARIIADKINKRL